MPSTPRGVAAPAHHHHRSPHLAVRGSSSYLLQKVPLSLPGDAAQKRASAAAAATAAAAAPRFAEVVLPTEAKTESPVRPAAAAAAAATPSASASSVLPWQTRAAPTPASAAEYRSPTPLNLAPDTYGTQRQQQWARHKEELGSRLAASLDYFAGNRANPSPRRNPASSSSRSRAQQQPQPYRGSSGGGVESGDLSTRHVRVSSVRTPPPPASRLGQRLHTLETPAEFTDPHVTPPAASAFVDLGTDRVHATGGQPLHQQHPHPQHHAYPQHQAQPQAAAPRQRITTPPMPGDDDDDDARLRRGPPALQPVDDAQPSAIDLESVTSILRSANLLRGRRGGGGGGGGEGGPIKIIPVALNDRFVEDRDESATPARAAAPPVQAVPAPQPRRAPSKFTVRNPHSDESDAAERGRGRHDGDGRFSRAAERTWSLEPSDHHHLVDPVSVLVPTPADRFDIEYTATRKGVFIDGLVAGGAAAQAGVPGHGRIARLNGLNIRGLDDLRVAKEMLEKRQPHPRTHELVVDVGVAMPANDATAGGGRGAGQQGMLQELGRMVTVINNGDKLLRFVRSHPTLTCQTADEVQAYLQIAGQRGVVTDADAEDRTVLVEFAATNFVAWLPMTVIEEYAHKPVSLTMPVAAGRPGEQTPREQRNRELASVGLRPETAAVAAPAARTRPAPPAVRGPSQASTATLVPSRAYQGVYVPGSPHHRGTRQPGGLRIMDPDIAESGLPLVDPLEELEKVPDPATNVRNIVDREQRFATSPVPELQRDYSPEVMDAEMGHIVDTLQLYDDGYVDGDQRVVPQRQYQLGQKDDDLHPQTYPQYGFDPAQDGVYLQDLGISRGERAMAARETTLFPPAHFVSERDSDQSSDPDDDAGSSVDLDLGPTEDADYEQRLKSFKDEMETYFNEVGHEKYKEFIAEKMYAGEFPPELAPIYRVQLDRMYKGRSPFNPKPGGGGGGDGEKKDEGFAMDDSAPEAAADGDGDGDDDDATKKKKKKKKKLKPEPKSAPADPVEKKPDPKTPTEVPPPPPPPPAPEAVPEVKKPGAEEKKKKAEAAKPTAAEEAEKAKEAEEEKKYLQQLNEFDEQMEAFYKKEKKETYLNHLEGLYTAGVIPPERKDKYDKQLAALKAGKDLESLSSKPASPGKKKKKPGAKKATKTPSDKAALPS